MSTLRKFTLGLGLVLAFGAGCRPVNLRPPVSYCPAPVIGNHDRLSTPTHPGHLPACQTR